MSSIITAIFKATIGLLVSKGRDKAVEKLKDGDVTDQRLRGLIVREIDDIKSKLNGLARKDLLASISFFKEGIELLYEVFDKTALARRECSEAVTAGTASGEAVALAQGMRKLELTAGLDESASRALVNAKKRFKRAREKGTEAFANEALELSDRMLAMQYRVMATILETLDHPEDALAACRVCIEELHSLSAVKECFSIELKKGFRARISKGERRAFISTVCHVNRVVYNVTLMVATHIEVFLLPYIEIGEEKVDPLRDSRVGKVLHKVGMEHCCVTPWSFGQEGEEQHKVKRPTAMVTNADGQFIIADSWNKTVKVFDNSGRFLLVFCPQPDEDGTKFVVAILDVATDANSNIYALVTLQETGTEREEMRWSCHVLVHSSAGDQLRKFPVRMKGGCGRLTVGKTKVLVAWGRVVDVFELDGEYVCSFGDEMMEVTDFTAGPDGQVLVLDSGGSCVYVFTEDGQQQSKFRIRTEEADRHVHYDRFVWHPGSEHVIAACVERGTKRLRVVMFTKVGKYHRTMNLDEKAYAYTVDGITVSVEGGIALAFTGHDENGKIIIVR